MVIIFMQLFFSLTMVIGLIFQFGLQPHHIMVEVLNALRQLNVCWKKIGHYNIKCMWSQGGQVQDLTKNCQHNGLHLGNEPATIQTNEVSQNTVKFELQVLQPSQLFLYFSSFPFSTLHMDCRSKSIILLSKVYEVDF